MARGFFFSFNFQILCQFNSLAWKQINDQIKGLITAHGKHCGDNFSTFVASTDSKCSQSWTKQYFFRGIYGHLFTHYLRLVCLFVGDQQNSKSNWQILMKFSKISALGQVGIYLILRVISVWILEHVEDFFHHLGDRTSVCENILKERCSKTEIKTAASVRDQYISIKLRHMCTHKLCFMCRSRRAHCGIGCLCTWKLSKWKVFGLLVLVYG